VVLALALVSHNSVRQGEQGVVSAAAHIGAGLNFCAALPDKDVAGQDELAVGSLGPKRLASLSRPFLVLPIPFLCAIYALHLLLCKSCGLFTR
jgi:hypothetical protein